MAAAGGLGEAGQWPSAATPPEVLAALVRAFGADKVGETGYEIDAARCCSEAEKEEARERGRSLLYGELLPDGVSKALLPGRLGDALTGDDIVLELGMGSGKVAMQIFLQRREARHVLGVELVPSRFAIASVALQQLVAAMPASFRLSAHNAGDAICIEEVGSGRKLEFRCGDFFAMGLDLCERSSIIFFAVNVPCKLFPHLCAQLAKAREGCRLFTYHPLDAIWWIQDPCPFRQCEANVSEADTFATSWSPQGFKFYVYVCDRSREPEIKADSLNDTFTEWTVRWDEASGAYYYHNQETESSQWEVPTQAGCWQAEFSDEHSAYYFWHRPTGHSQWDVPKCLADLGWGNNSG